MKRILIIFLLGLFVPLFNYGECRAQYTAAEKKIGPTDNNILGYGQKDPGEDEEAPDLSAPVELWTYISDYRFISGKMINLTVQMLWKLGINVNTKEFETVDLSPFKIEKVTIGERQIFNNDRDYQLITYSLSLPDQEKEGEYTIPAFSISYKDEVNQINDQAQTSPIPLRKVPIILEADVDKDFVNLGDRMNYKITIWHERYVEILKDNMKTFKFSPFQVINYEFKEETEGRLKKLTANYEISIYDLAEKGNSFEIPSLPILYYTKTDEELIQDDDEKLFITHKVSTPAILVSMNSLLKRIDVPLERIKGPVKYPQKSICLRGHLPIIFGVIIILVLGVLEAKKYVGRFAKVVKEKIVESSLTRAEKLQELVEDFNFDAETNELRKSIVNAGCAFRVFLGSMAEAPQEKVLSFTTTKIINALKDKKIAGNVIESANNTLKTFDSAIFGNIDKAVIEKIINEIKEILKETNRRGYY